MSGGLFATLAFVHFLVDWVFQTHAEAMAKHDHPWVRARHCTIYTIGFLPVLLAWGWDVKRLAIGCAVLFLSHFAEDTYLPVYWWAKHIRRVPVVRERGLPGFVEWSAEPLGKILMIAIDQIIHLCFLWVLVYIELGVLP